MRSEGWATPTAPRETRAAHYYRSDSPMFARLRSICGGSSFPEPVRLDAEPPPGVPTCTTCATSSGAIARAGAGQTAICDRCPNISDALESVDIGAGRTFKLCARCAAFYLRAAARFKKEIPGD